MKNIGKQIEYFGIKTITNETTALSLGISPYDNTVLVQFDNDTQYWYKLSWCKEIN